MFLVMSGFTLRSDPLCSILCRHQPDASIVAVEEERTWRITLRSLHGPSLKATNIISAPFHWLELSHWAHLSANKHREIYSI